MRLARLALVLVACGGSPSPSATTATPSVPRSTFAEIDDDHVETVGVDDVYRADLFRGVPEETPTEALGSRFQVRPLEIPRPGRGGTRRFAFEDGKRGWITALPSSEMLTTPTYGDGKVFLGGGFAFRHYPLIAESPEFAQFGAGGATRTLFGVLEALSDAGWPRLDDLRVCVSAEAPSEGLAIRRGHHVWSYGLAGA